MSKYEKLWKYISEQKQEEIELTFKEIEQIINIEIDHSFLNLKKELIDYGYQVNKISLKNKKIIFKKIK